ncbi:MAG: GNAT family N-acetyltransferase [Granulosicoccus sp.]
MSSTKTITWKQCRIDQLSAREVYLLAKLRIDVFVVEQACPYAELDGLDLLESTLHILACEGDIPVAYARILAPECEKNSARHLPNKPARIGRVVVAHAHRRQGLATAVMRCAIKHCESEFSGHDQRLAAQVSVENFYVHLGFTPCSDHYLEDGIAHVDMVRPSDQSVTSEPQT